jgi:hypothetical protein
LHYRCVCYVMGSEKPKFYIFTKSGYPHITARYFNGHVNNSLKIQPLISPRLCAYICVAKRLCTYVCDARSRHKKSPIGGDLKALMFVSPDSDYGDGYN